MGAEVADTDLTNDAFLGGAVRALQPRGGYRAGIDAVLLAAAIPAKLGSRMRVLDAGAGAGVASLCLAARVPDADIVLVEKDVATADIARRNISRNGLDPRASVVTADVTARAAVLTPLGLAPDSFDHTMANPPFGIEGHGRRPADRQRATAHEMPVGALESWLRFLARVTRPGGTVTLVHRADALGDLLFGISPWFGAVAVQPIHPRAGEPAVRVIVQGVKASRAALRILPALVLHAADGAFTPAVAALLRTPAPLDLGR